MHPIHPIVMIPIVEHYVGLVRAGQRGSAVSIQNSSLQEFVLDHAFSMFVLRCGGRSAGALNQHPT